MVVTNGRIDKISNALHRNQKRKWLVFKQKQLLENRNIPRDQMIIIYSYSGYQAVYTRNSHLWMCGENSLCRKTSLSKHPQWRNDEIIYILFIYMNGKRIVSWICYHWLVFCIYSLFTNFTSRICNCRVNRDITYRKYHVWSTFPCSTV